MFETIQTVQCWEICKSDRLLGYVIFFSGGWDVYVSSPLGMQLKSRNHETKEQAIKAAKEALMLDV